MDCGGAGTAAGIDPKNLENWQTDAAFSIASWEPSTYEQPQEWDTSQDSSQGDGDIVDLNFFSESLTRDPLDVSSLLARSSDFYCNNPESTSPEKFSLPDGTLSGTISPRTIHSSTDDNFNPDESWPQFQLFNSVASSLPMENPLFYPYAKEPATSNTVIVEDAGEGSNGPGFSNGQPGQFMFQGVPPQTYQFVPEPWDDTPVNPTTTTTTTDDIASIQGPIPLSMGPPQPGVKETSPINDFNNSLRPLESRWLDNLDAQIPTNMASTTFPTIPQDLRFHEDGQPGPDGLQYKSESSSVSGDLSGARDGSYSATSDEVPTFAERHLDEDESKAVEWKDDDTSIATSQPLQTTTAYVVSEEPSESLIMSVPSRPRASSNAAPRTAARSAPLALQSVATVRKRKQRNPAISVDQAQSMPLQIVQEDGQGGSIASADFVSPPRGARRKGPLSMVGRANAGLRRKNKDTCVQCRLNKRKCDGSAPCDACRPTLHEQPCARACFASIVEYGTCNYISQRAINHPKIDGSGRVRMEIPSAFDLSDLLSFLGERQGRFNIRASQAWGSLYVLDLSETYRFLKGLSEHNGNSRSTFLEFIDRRIIESKDKSKNWLTCVKDCDPMNNVYSLLSQWNNMPSRASYSFVPLEPDSQERPMDINNPEDHREILLAAQLSRIICRMLEVEGFRKLERDFYNIKWKQISNETHLRFLGELGHLLLSLRWRVSWWKRLGDGGQQADPTQQHYVDRVELLCRILYVYYTCVLAKLPSWSLSDVPKGIWSTYADSENPIWDDYPSDPSENGFQTWMERGQELIEQAGVPNRVSRI